VCCGSQRAARLNASRLIFRASTQGLRPGLTYAAPSGLEALDYQLLMTYQTLIALAGCGLR
jgi:hypothetical protein